MGTLCKARHELPQKNETIMKFFADLPIAVRVGALSAIAVVAIGVLLGTALYSQQIVSHEIDNLAEYSQMNFKVSQVQAHAQNMQRSQKDFLLNKDLAFSRNTRPSSRKPRAT